ncbi:MAG: PAS domain S-box protein [Phycisphaera sp.]|nr:PAS domain S-box protein [Phycisphaera sp.]
MAVTDKQVDEHHASASPGGAEGRATDPSLLVRVLMIDDDEQSFRLVEALMDIPGCHLDWINTYDAGLAAVLEQKHDVYIVDHQLGAKTGLDLIREARLRGCRSPMIMLTTLDDPTVDDAAMHAGADDYLVKGQMRQRDLGRAIRYAVSRQKLSEAQREADALYASLIEKLPAAVFRKDREGKLVYVSSRYCGIHGARPEELLGRDAYDMFDKDAADRYTAEDRRILDQGEIVESINEHVSASGKRSWVHRMKTPVRDAHGDIVGIHGMFFDITDRMLTEQELRESQLRLRLLSNQLPAIVWATDRKLRFTFVEGAGMRGLHVDADQIVGKTVQAYFGAENPEFLPLEMHRRALRGDSVTYEHDWGGRTVHAHLEPLRGEDGRIIGAVGIALDISRRRGAEVQLRQREQLLQQIINIIPHPIFWKDRQGHFLGANQSLARDLGFDSPDEMIGKTDVDASATPEQIDAYRECDERVMETGQPILNLEETQTRPDGKVATLLTSKVPLTDATGKVIGMLGIYNDITDRIRAERQLAESQQQVARLMSNLPGMAYRCLDDEDWTMLFASAGCFELTGHKPAALISGEVKYNDLIHPDDRDKVRDIIHGSIEIRLPYQLIYRIVTKDGRLKWVWEKGSGVYNDAGEVEALEGFINDITEQRQTDDAMRRVNNNLEMKNRELEQFAYVASHDLQEPLRMVVTYLQLIEKRYADVLDEQGREFMTYAVGGGKRMQSLIRDLLAFSRVDTNKPRPHEAIDTEDALEQAMANLDTLLIRHTGEVRHEPLPRVVGDHTMLVQLFQNLIGNAIKFHGDAIPHIRIAASKPNHAGLATFSVADNGMGIDPRHTKRIFDVFQRVHTRDEHVGTGIGLAICKKIVEYHGGRIWVESEPGHGATFLFTLPVASDGVTSGQGDES